MTTGVSVILLDVTRRAERAEVLSAILDNLHKKLSLKKIYY